MIEFKEDVTDAPVDSDKALSDEELTGAGLVQVSAWMRTKSGKAAARVQKCREKKEQEGFKQLNVVAPTNTHDAIRELVSMAGKDEDMNQVMRSYLASHAQTTMTPDEKKLHDLGAKVASLSGWKRKIAVWLGLL